MAARLVTRRRLAELNEQDWQDFRKHWPMRVVQVLGEFGGGFMFGLALGMASFLWVLQCAAELL